MTSSSPNIRQCLRCGGRLEIGTIPDRGHGDRELPSEWEGPKPAPKTAFGMPVYQPPGERLPITALRCPRCGMVELVAGGSGPF